MKRILVLIGVVLNFVSTEAQNLVPNWSFEDTLTNPAWAGFINPDCAIWQTPLPGAAKYVNNNDPNCINCGLIVQSPRTGDAWALIYTNCSRYNAPDFRDVLQAPLLDTLKSGKKYCISFYVSRYDYSNYACNNIGALLSPSPITNSGSILSLTPTIANDPVNNPLLSDSTWIEVSGTFIATGTERYIIIGNFNDDASSDTIYMGEIQSGENYSSYLIDDVSVIEVPDCFAGGDTTICRGDSAQLGILPVQGVSYFWQPSAGLSNPNISNPKASPLVSTAFILTQTICDVVSFDTVTISVRQDCNYSPFAGIILAPNPNDGNANLFYNLSEGGTLEIYNVLGQIVWKSDLPPGDRRETIWMPFAEGLYSWRVIAGGQTLGSGKVEIVRESN